MTPRPPAPGDGLEPSARPRFDRALQLARAQLDAPAPLPSFADVESAMRRGAVASQSAGRSTSRRSLASLAALLALTTMATDALIGAELGVPLLFALLLPVVVLGASAVLVHRESLGAQLFCRAAWWAHLVLGLAWSLGPPESLPAAGSVLTLSSGVALLAVGRAGLLRQDTARVFDPVAFRGTVLLSMLLGLADAQLLGQLGLTFLEADEPQSHPLLLLWCAAALGLGVWGLSRLRVWAVGLHLLAQLAVLLAVLWVQGRTSPVFWLLGASAAVQLLLPLRMLLAFRRGAPPQARGRELSPWITTVPIVAAMLASIPAGLLGTYAPLMP